MANRRFIQFFKTLHNEPVLLDCNFIVDSSNGNGLGIRSLKGPGIAQVYMNSSASFVGTTHSSTLVDGISSTASLVAGMPVQGSGIAAGTTISSVASSSSIILSAATSTSVSSGTITYQGVGSPNPAAGLIVVKLQDNYNRYFGGWAGFVGPTGASTTSAKANVINIITVLGTATTAQWVAAGLPIGVTPAVGVSFIGANSSVIGGSAQTAVALAAGAGIDHIEVVGDSNLSLAPAGAPNYLNGAGGLFYLRCYKNTALTAPTDGTAIGLSFYLSNTRILANGE